jgi:hypothetical protein
MRPSATSACGKFGIEKALEECKVLLLTLLALLVQQYKY